MKYYQIEKEKQSGFARRKTLRLVLILLVVQALILGFLLFGSNQGQSLLNAGFIWPPIIISILFGIIWYNSNSNIAKSFVFGLDEENGTVTKTLKNENLNAQNQIGTTIAEAKHGTKQIQVITFDRMTAIDFKENEIVIDSLDYNFWNGNGKISVPKEIEDYESLKLKLKALNKRLADKY